MTPPCYNRPPRAPGAWMRSGYRGGKPVLRWVPAFAVDRCAVHDGTGIGPNGEGYAEAHGWDCSGCRWESGHDDDPDTSWLREHMRRASDEYQAFRDKAAALGIWIRRDPWVNPVPEITMRD